MYFAEINKSEFFLRDIIHDKNVSESEIYSMISYILSSLTLLLFFSLTLPIFWTSAAVYTIACIYTAEETTYTKVMQVVVRKVWKRLMITYILNFLIFFAFIIGALLVIIQWPVTLEPSATGIMVAIILLVYLSGILYISFVCHLANVVSVLEDLYGIQAMLKSNSLIKGNTGLSAALFLIHNLCFLGIHLGFEASAGGGDSSWGMLLRIFLWAMLMSMLILFGLVIQTIIYFICKSYHHENIYVQLDSEDVQLQQSINV